MTQCRLPLRNRYGHGGKRAGAGRKTVKGRRAGVSHHGRARFCACTPVHVTVRALPHVWNLRSKRAFGRLKAAFAPTKRRAGFRLIHFSVQGNHMHLICEAQNEKALSRGMQGLLISAAKRLNAMMGRRGRVFADRFHAHLLKTPREVRNALAYLFGNAREHARRLGRRVLSGMLDPFTSCAAFDGFCEELEISTSALDPPVQRPRGWLLTAGWRRHGLIGA